MKHAYAVILAGGSGERFWPLSTRGRPKQFISLFGGKPLLTLAVERLNGLIPPERTFIITANHLVAETLAAARSIPASHVIGEPCKRDTAAAVAVACGLVRRCDPEGVVCILTADQLMRDIELFRQTLADSILVSREMRSIVTMGIPPTYPATGFGYIEAGKSLETRTVTPFHAAKRFVEKPDPDTAQRYFAAGDYYWNAGMFIWTVDVMQEALRQFAPDLAELAEAVSTPDVDLAQTFADVYPTLRSISIDYAVMEHAKNIIMADGAFGWDDVGSWPSLAGHFAADASGNVVVGACEPMESENNIVVSENRLTALIGVQDLIVIQSAEATLVCPRDRAQDVKKLLRRIAQRPDGERYV